MRPYTHDQIKKIWAMVSDVAKQCAHPVEGRLPKESWMPKFLHALGGEIRLEADLYGEGKFPTRWSLSGLEDLEKVSMLIELVAAYGAEHGVSWSDPEWVSQQLSLGAAA